MTKILLTGGDSFIAESLCSYLISQNHEISKPARQNLDVTNSSQLKDYLSWFKPDYVVHTAVSGDGSNKDTRQDFRNNILMTLNLLDNKDLYKKIILLDSGASFDRGTDIFNRKEADYHSIPEDKYGSAKYFQTKLFQKNPQAINLRIFNVFGPLEKDSRFIKTTIRKCLNNEDVHIWADQFFSFFSIQDFSTLITHLINNPPKTYFDLNCCYPDYFKLSHVANMIKKLTKSKSKIFIDKESELNYNGNGDKLYSMELNLLGMERSLREIINVG